MLKKTLLNSIFFRKNLIVKESKTELNSSGAPEMNKIKEIVVDGCTVLKKKYAKQGRSHRL